MTTEVILNKSFTMNAPDFLVSYHNQSGVVKLVVDKPTSYVQVVMGEGIELSTKVDIVESEISMVTINLSSDLLTTSVVLNHIGHRTKSDLSTIAVGVGQGKLEVNNTATIASGVKKAEVIQSARGLTIGNSQIVTRPILEIADNDCLAKHASAVGSLSLDELFYLMSRGISETEAIRIYVYGILNPVIEKLESFPQNESLTQLIEKIKKEYPIFLTHK